VQVLSRRQKNNPILIGEPGVGKTAIAEGLAQRIVNGDVPESLKGRTLISLDMGSLIAGAKLRGEFEERLRMVLKEVTDSAGQIVLFIDELHTVVGAGGNQGAMDASNLLKPMLARGELRCIGATTIDEYRKYIEKDPALERRFQPVQVNEPTVEDTISILRGLKERYEVHHGVKISDAALVSAATLSSRYIADRFLPDKAIDLVDEAAAKLKMEITSKPTELESIDRRVMQLEMENLSLQDETLTSDTHRPTQERLEKIDAEITILKVKQEELTNQWQGEKQLLDGIKSLREQEEQLKVQSEQAERAGDIATVGRLQYGEIPKLQKERSVKETELAAVQVQGSTLLREQVSENDIAEIVAKWTGIPVNRLLASERQKLLQLESHLHNRVIGQHEAVSAVSAAIRRARAGMQDPQRPIGSFLFMGPTGVGKTELARALAEFLFDSDEAMVRLDMSEYMEKHAVSRLIGAPPGYVGHEDGGQLTEAVRRRPYSVVLFDEIEKAHPDVFNILLQVLDDGRITDSKGKTVSFCNTVIVMTSNIASDQIINTLLKPDRDNTQTNDLREQVTNTLRLHFRPEFINRIDELTIFEPLKKTELRQIVTIQIHQIERMLADQKIKIQLTSAAQDYLADVGYDPIYGARPLKRAIQRELQNPIATKILETAFGEGDTIFVDCVDRVLTFDTKPLKVKKSSPAIIPEVVLSTVVTAEG
jgi:ATP-dependent Clp protease ATP-binding subunit ClpB